MSKHEQGRKQTQQKEQRQSQQESQQSRQSAEQEEVAGRHKNEGQKDHKGADKGPRGQ